MLKNTNDIFNITEQYNFIIINLLLCILLFALNMKQKYDILQQDDEVYLSQITTRLEISSILCKNKGSITLYLHKL